MLDLLIRRYRSRPLSTLLPYFDLNGVDGGYKKENLISMTQFYIVQDLSLKSDRPPRCPDESLNPFRFHAALKGTPGEERWRQHEGWLYQVVAKHVEPSCFKTYFENDVEVDHPEMGSIDGLAHAYADMFLVQRFHSGNLNEDWLDSSRWSDSEIPAPCWDMLAETKKPVDPFAVASRALGGNFGLVMSGKHFASGL